MKIILSLYDYTGHMVQPWAAAGYECYCFDIEHREVPRKIIVGSKGGSITFVKVDLYSPTTYNNLLTHFNNKEVSIVFGFPVCTDLAVSGAAWFAKKRLANPEFQTTAANHAVDISYFATTLNSIYMIENPISVLSTLWRKPNYKFHPFEYGGYIPKADAVHPDYPEYIAPGDAYKKKTCLWTCDSFKMPPVLPVDPEHYHGNGYSTAMMKLGGKSKRTKSIRSATPRGFALAVFDANHAAINNQFSLAAE